MRHLLSTVAVAALISVAAPASAQTPLTPGPGGRPADSVAAPPAEPPPAAARPRAGATSTGRHGFDPSDNVADQLNAQQLGQAAAPPPYPAAAAAPPGYGAPPYGPPGYGPPGYGPPGYPPPYGPYGHPGWGYAPPAYPWGPPGIGFPPPY